MTEHDLKRQPARNVRRAAFVRTSDAALSRRLTALRPSRERKSQTKQPKHRRTRVQPSVFSTPDIPGHLDSQNLMSE
jgi:hypothetical protein